VATCYDAGNSTPYAGTQPARKTRTIHVFGWAGSVSTTTVAGWPSKMTEALASCFKAATFTSAQAGLGKTSFGSNRPAATWRDTSS
jgi:hypothetical protein